MTSGRIDTADEKLALAAPDRGSVMAGREEGDAGPVRPKARRAVRALTLLAAAVLAACGSSPPIRYHALSVVAPPGTPRAAYDGPAIEVGSVQVPPVLTRPELVRDTAVGRFEIREFDHWAALLPRLARQTFAEDLEARLPVGKVVYPGASWPRPGAVLEVDVLSFRVEGGVATMALSWSLRQRAAPGSAATSESLRGAQLRLETPIAEGNGAEATTRAWNDLLRQLADRVVADVSGRAPS